MWTKSITNLTKSNLSDKLNQDNLLLKSVYSNQKYVYMFNSSLLLVENTFTTVYRCLYNCLLDLEPLYLKIDYLLEYLLTVNLNLNLLIKSKPVYCKKWKY